MPSMQVDTLYNKDQIISKTMIKGDDDLLTEISRKIVHLQDEGVKQALINLGWTPPKEEVPNG